MYRSQDNQNPVGSMNMNKFLDFLEISGDWSLLLDPEDTVTFCHKSDSASYSLVPDDLIGQPFTVFPMGQGKRKVMDLIHSCKNVREANRRTTYIDATGCHIEVDVIARWEDDGFIGYAVLIKNLSERLSTGWTRGDSSRVSPETLEAPTEEQQAEQALQLQLKQQELVTGLSMIFSSISNFDVTFNKALRMVGEFLEADRIYLFQDDSPATTFSCRYEWCSPHAAPIIQHTQGVPYDNQHDSYLQLLTLPFVAINDTALLPVEEHQKPKDMGIQAFINLPISVEGVFWGFLGIDSCRKPRNWTISEISLVQTIGGIITTSLQRRRMESTISSAYAKLDGIVKNYPGIIWYLDPDYTLTLCEGMAIRELGMEALQLEGKSLNALGEPYHDFFAFARATFEEGPQTYVLEVGERSITCNTNVVRDNAGNVIGQVGVAQDITELRQMQRDLEKAIDAAENASRAKTDFLSRMSHEIRTPMNAIIGMNSIARKAGDMVKVQYCLDKIENASKQLLGLINDILDMSKIEANKFELSDNEFDFEKMLQNVCNVINIKVEEKHQNFLIDFDDVFLTHVVCDELRLSQVIINLLTNAVKFTPEEGNITLKIRHYPVDDVVSRLHIEVQDSGIGVPPEQQQRLFQSFEQADGSTTRRFGGTGLGLAICKKIVTLMGGEIWVESEDGQGSNFVFDVDIKWGRELESNIDHQPLDSRKIRILTIDDSEDVRLFFLNTLSNFGLRSDAARNGQEALDLLRLSMDKGDPYNLIFVDWLMPGMGGMETSRRIKDLVGDGAIIIMISVADWSDLEADAIKSGVSRFLPKPVLPSTLFNTVMETMEYSMFTGVKTPAAPVYRWTGKHILLAEDIEINREIILSILEDTDVTVDCAVNGREAVDRFTASPERYNLILMDIQMPELDGLQATALIRDSGLPHSATVPILAMTANAFKEDVQQCLAVGMNDHIAKPINLEELMTKLDMILG